MQKEAVEVFYPVNVQKWRKWLEDNHLSKQAVWVVFYNKKSEKKTISWSEAVDVALCYGWIDSKKTKIDDESSHQFFSKRKAQSTWSKINKEKIQLLIEKGLMSKAGLASIEIAKQNGSWTILDEVEELKVPQDLEEAFQKHEGSKEYYLSLSKSNRKAILQWIVLARRPETRQQRIDEIARLAKQKIKPKHLQ
jgi:uncharacterized protein YdeI (YjbR/CyaY-like superfamily)